MARMIRLPTIKRPKRNAREEFAASLDIIGSSLGDGSFSFEVGCPFFGEDSISFDTRCSSLGEVSLSFDDCRPFFANFSPSFGIFVPSFDILATS